MWISSLDINRLPVCCCPASSCLFAGDTSAPAVFDAVSAAISTGIGQHLPGPSLEGGAGGAAGAAGGPSWRPRGVLASHLMEHRWELLSWV